MIWPALADELVDLCHWSTTVYGEFAEELAGNRQRRLAMSSPTSRITEYLVRRKARTVCSNSPRRRWGSKPPAATAASRPVSRRRLCPQAEPSASSAAVTRSCQACGRASCR